MLADRAAYSAYVEFVPRMVLGTILIIGVPFSCLVTSMAWVLYRWGQHKYWSSYAVVAFGLGICLTLLARFCYPRWYSHPGSVAGAMIDATVSVALILFVPVLLLAIGYRMRLKRAVVISVAILTQMFIAILSGPFVALVLGCELTGQCV